MMQKSVKQGRDAVNVVPTLFRRFFERVGVTEASSRPYVRGKCSPQPCGMTHRSGENAQNRIFVEDFLADLYHIGKKDEIFTTIWYFRILMRTVTLIPVYNWAKYIYILRSGSNR
jgi:hypothetical protein